MLPTTNESAPSHDYSLAGVVLRNVRTEKLHVEEFSAAAGEAWCLLGDNRSGIDSFVHIIAGTRQPEHAGHLFVSGDLAVVSFKTQQELFEAEVRKDDSDFLNRVDPGTLAREFLGPVGNVEELVRLFRLEHVLDSGYRQLSSGEGRKLLLLEAITHGARHIFVEQPYEGLDVKACGDFDEVMRSLRGQGIGVIIVVSSRNDVPDWCSHCLVAKDGLVCVQGEREKVLDELQDNGARGDWSGFLTRESVDPADDAAPELVHLVNGQARYGGRRIFEHLDLRVARGEHTLVTGPNGAGKSTLLALITGDHPDCYTNELYIFGIKRGSGESIWELKKDMGVVSPALHREHYVPGNALQIVISGFHDSIGLYRRYSPDQAETARGWLARIGLADRATVPFRRLGFAEQRLVLIARALIKLPRLLILDEPTQGLDDKNRANLLDFLEKVAERQISTILYVSHRPDEYRSFFRQQLEIPLRSDLG
jgi:molybdate transport system ATP-binding protein